MRTYRVLSPEGEVLTEVVSTSLEEAAVDAENMGYSVVDVSEPDVVVARDNYEDFTSIDYPSYDPQTAHYERWGRPAFPNEY